MAEASRQRALVTGAAGFIGSRLCEMLVQRGWQVLGVDNLNDYYDVRLKHARLERMGIAISGVEEVGERGRTLSSRYEGLEFEVADIRDRDRMEGLFRDYRPDAVMNLAAQAGVRYSIENPYSYVTNNVDGFLVLLECARHYPVKRFVYASSSSIYGSNDKVPFSETDVVDNPVSLYAATKKSNEMMARAYHNLFGIPAVGLRFFTVYGPWGRPDMAPMLFADAICGGKPIRLFNHGDMKRDFTYIDDIVEGVVKVMEDTRDLSVGNDLYNIGHGSPVDLMEFVGLMERAFGADAVKEYLPMQPGDVTVTYADTSKLEKDYGYRPSTELPHGIKDFAEWYLSDKNPLNPRC